MTKMADRFLYNCIEYVVSRVPANVRPWLTGGTILIAALVIFLHWLGTI